MKITALVENTSDCGLPAEHGLSLFVETNGIRFDSGNFKLGELSVNMIELDPQVIGGVLVHWYPKFDISTKNDPYCSVYMLSTHEIRKIINRINKIHEYYETHSTSLASLK